MELNSELEQEYSNFRERVMETLMNKMDSACVSKLEDSTTEEKEE